MFRSSKTLIDKHIGILVDRYTKKRTTTSVTKQSFLGRASGYNRSPDVIVYTDMINAEKSLEIFVNGWLNTSKWKATHCIMGDNRNFKST